MRRIHFSTRKRHPQMLFQKINSQINFLLNQLNSSVDFKDLINHRPTFKFPGEPEIRNRPILEGLESLLISLEKEIKKTNDDDDFPPIHKPREILNQLDIYNNLESKNLLKAYLLNLKSSLLEVRYLMRLMNNKTITTNKTKR